MQNKNFFLAMALIAGFLIMWSVVIVPRFSPKPATPMGTEPAAMTATAVPTEQITSAHLRKGQPIVWEDAIFRDQNTEIVFRSTGGSVNNWRLKLKNDEIDMVLHPDGMNLPLATFPLTTFKTTIRQHEVLMQATLDNGLRLSKTLSLSPTGHLHRLKFAFHNPTSRTIEIPQWTVGWGPGIGTDPGELKENPSLIRAIALGKMKVKNLDSDEKTDLVRWAGLDNRYYLVAFIPQQQRPVQVTTVGEKDMKQLLLVDRIVVGPGQTLDVGYDLYIGPKGFTQLKNYQHDLEKSVDFGTFEALGKLILRALDFLKEKTGNYGVAIILLTIGIQLLMLPLTLKSFKATMAMKKLQPKIAELQARFKTDPKRLNVEMMNLYKGSKTNPFGGCLPMLAQLPIFLALYTALRNASELRGAPFFGWMTDLSTPDVLFQISSFPIHALPLIMGGAMYFQQRMSGAVSDPMQRQMMTIMPVMFTVMFYGFPSGLVLYWLTNNLMTMASQTVFTRLHTEKSHVIETTLVK